jgi:uncharacterized protein (TIGR02217 family)
MAGIVVLADIIAPNSLFEAGVTGRQIRRNRRAENRAGIPVVNVDWSYTRREFTWGTVPHTLAVWQTLEGLFEVTDAGGYGFLIQDPKDPRADHTTGTTTLINAGAHTYQLVKQYTFTGAAAPHNRPIRYPKATGFELKISGVTKTAGVDYTLNDETGVVTIASDPSASTVTWAGIYYVPVHFQSDEIEWELAVAGGEDQRYVVGPRVVLQEIKQA